MKIYLPENLDLEKLVRGNLPADIPKFANRKLAIILSQIYSARASNRNLIDKDGFVPLHTTILQNLIREYRLYLDYAKAAGVIFEKRQFIQHKKCRHFKFAPEYQTALRDFIDERTMLPLLIKSKKRNQNFLPQEFAFLEKPFKSGDLEFDFTSALDLYTRRFAYYIKHPDKFPINERTGIRRNPADQYNHAKYVIDRMQHEDYFWKFDESAGRFHTSLTNLPKLMRNFLTFAGERIVTVDVSNCQPYLVNGLTNLPFYLSGAKIFQKNVFSSSFSSILEELNEKEKRKGCEENFNITRVNKEVARRILKQEETTLSLVTLVNWVQTHASRELQWFWNATTTGQYYDRLQYYLAKDVDAKFMDKTRVKVESLRILFTGNKYIYQPEATAVRWFAENVKGIFDIGWFLKSIDKAIYPILLQSMEAEIMLNRVARRINREHPKLPIFPIHDSLATTVGNEEYVSKVMKEEFASCIGAPPHLKLEKYGPDNQKLLSLPY